ncbi:cytochrome c oxidase assembly protein COX19 [Rhypophila decipiens]
MSTFGSPGALPTTKPTPPQRGSFPLDHDGELSLSSPCHLLIPTVEFSPYSLYAGECKHVMATYLNCIKKVKGVNEDQCRQLAKSYLSCRMERNLMAKDDFKNLGFKEEPSPGASQDQSSEKGAQGELRW